ncbi:hypothetical protein [Fibrobacter succinogenes]|uniref:hypothetical protein n=1 Tax=Fibrobacter succinogenes TaxID=833 RepID=UPI0015661364|nr:hypothetical protein [Fibrobacter succinogenes]
MNHKMLFVKLGTATVITAFGLAACGDDTSSGSNQCEALSPECGYTVEELCRMGVKQYCPEQSSSSEVENSSSSIENGGNSSSVQEQSSSSEVLSSSSVVKSSSSDSGETCIHISDFPPDSDYDDWCHGEGERAVDCVTQEVYICDDMFWKKVETCRDVAPTTCDAPGCGPKHCDAKDSLNVFDCKSGDEYKCNGMFWEYVQPKVTCSHITDNECVITEGCSMTPCMQGTVTVDCARHVEFTCDGGTWTPSIPQEGKSCLAEGDVQNARVDDAGGSFMYVPYQCKDGKWTEYHGDFGAREDCSLNAIVGRECKDGDPGISTDNCVYVCDGETYQIAPPPPRGE